jgi:transcription elongation factor GreA
MGKMSYHTKDGLQSLKEELEKLMNVERPRISQMIAEARDKGDLSENAEYDAAKDAQGMLEMRISQLQDLLRNARVIDESKLDTSKVQILCKVKVRNLRNDKDMYYTLVPANEADFRTGRISVDSPVGKGLLGKSVGDKVDIQVPAGVVPFEIVEITKD